MVPPDSPRPLFSVAVGINVNAVRQQLQASSRKLIGKRGLKFMCGVFLKCVFTATLMQFQCTGLCRLLPATCAVFHTRLAWHDACVSPPCCFGIADSGLVFPRHRRLWRCAVPQITHTRHLVVVVLPSSRICAVCCAFTVGACATPKAGIGS